MTLSAQSPKARRPRPRPIPQGPQRQRIPKKRIQRAEPVKLAVPSRALPNRALVCRPEELSFDSIASTSMFNTLGKVRALPANEASRAIVCRTIAEARGYATEDLQAMAEIGYHYIRNGGYKLAAVIFEGLTAIQPSEPYYALALGLTKDYLGDKDEARKQYNRARKLDPKDPRPDLNLAELDFEAGQRPRALRWLESAKKKAKAVGEAELLTKAEALLSFAR